MRPRHASRPLAALLYGAALIVAIPGALAGLSPTAVAEEAQPVLEQRALAEIRELASEALPKLVVHEEPRGPYKTPFKDGNGETASLTRFAGKVVVLNMWATWCPPCRAEMPTLDNLQAALEGTDAEVVALSTDRGGAPKVVDFFADTGNPDHRVIEHLDIYVDKTNKIAREMALLGLPVTLILDREGREIARLSGDAHWDTPEVVALVKRVVAMTEATVRDAQAPGDAPEATPVVPPETPYAPDSPLAGTAL